MSLIRVEHPLSGITLGLWHISEDLSDLEKSAVLHDQERKNLLTYRNEIRKKQWLATRLLLREMMAPLHPEIIYDDHGKPSVSKSSTHISIAHSSEYVSLILSEKSRCGIDIEVRRDKIFKVAGRFLSKEEAGHVEEPFRLEKLLIHWSGKEALYKLAGIPGLDLQNEIILRGFDYLCGARGSCTGIIRHDSQSATFPLFYHVEEEYILAYAVDLETEDDEKKPEI